MDETEYRVYQKSITLLREQLQDRNYIKRIWDRKYTRWHIGIKRDSNIWDAWLVCSEHNIDRVLEGVSITIGEHKSKKATQLLPIIVVNNDDGHATWCKKAHPQVTSASKGGWARYGAEKASWVVLVVPGSWWRREEDGVAPGSSSSCDMAWKGTMWPLGLSSLFCACDVVDRGMQWWPGSSSSSLLQRWRGLERLSGLVV